MEAGAGRRDVSDPLHEPGAIPGEESVQNVPGEHEVVGPLRIAGDLLQQPGGPLLFIVGGQKALSDRVTVLRDGRVIGALALEDRIRPESRAAVAALQERGVKVALITGDARQVAEAVGADLGIDEVMAEVLPEDKDAKVAELDAPEEAG